MKDLFTHLFQILAFSLMASPLSAQQMENKGLTLIEDGVGIDHKITVESAGNFRLAFESGLNYGLSQWFDLYHDPNATTDLTDNETSYIPVHEQGALFNQCINPDYLIAHVAGARNHFKDVPRSIKVIESGPVRVILENEHHPMLGKKNESLLFKTRYTIYPNGRIFIKNTFSATKTQEITMWRNSIVGLSDPTYMVHSEAGEMVVVESKKVVDKSKKWRVNQWQGFQLNLPDWRSFDIISNSEDTLVLGQQIAGGQKPLKGGKYKIASNPVKFGWLRGDSILFPKQWHNKSAQYIYAYWDPNTPEPYKNWSSASIMLVPAPNNVKQGGGVGIHGWKGFKRMYYEYGQFTLKKGEAVSQEYLMVLGSNKNKNLPDLRQKEMTDREAEFYASDNSTALNRTSGAYKISLANGVGGFINKYEVGQQVFELPASAETSLKVDGKILEKGNDYLTQKSHSGTQIVLLKSGFTAYKEIKFLGK